MKFAYFFFLTETWIFKDEICCKLPVRADFQWQRFIAIVRWQIVSVSICVTSFLNEPIKFVGFYDSADHGKIEVKLTASTYEGSILPDDSTLRWSNGDIIQ
jgi:hypothetical protein